MKCHYCGTALPENAVFCRHCGTRRETVPAARQVFEPAAISEVPAAVAADPREFPMPKAAPVFDEETFSWKPNSDEFFDMPVPIVKPAPQAPAPAAVSQPVNQLPRILLPAKRSLAKMIFLGILTLGIYPIVIWSRIVTELNIAASRYDGRRTMPYFGMLLLSPVTLGIHSLVWMHELSDRIGCELRRRNLSYNFGARDFWIWNFLASLLVLAAGVMLYILLEQVHYAVWMILGIVCIIGPYVYVHKLMKAMNLVNADFNVNG